MKTRCLFRLFVLVAALASAAACTNRIDVEEPAGAGQAPDEPPGEPPGPGNGTIGTPGDPQDPGSPGDPGGSADPGDPGEPPAPTMRQALRADLAWKRYRAVENDLVRALALSKETLCNELGAYACVDEVHLAPLGGNEPFEKSQYEPARTPTAVTPVALDRVVLAACSRRVSLDTTSSPQVFTALDLGAGALSPDDGAVEETVVALYRRLLARDPLPEEVELARQLTTDDEGQPVSAADFAKLACYAVGTSVELLFY